MTTGSRKREWRDQRAHHLYSLATTSIDGNMRREALLFLGALERAGSKDAAWAMDAIRRRGKDPGEGPPSRDGSVPNR